MDTGDAVKLVNPWGHPDFEPTDSTLWRLAANAIEASGGTTSAGGSRPARRRAACLESWFRATIPDVLGLAFDSEAIGSLADSLTTCEGSGDAVSSWGRAVIAHFGRHPQWPRCYREDSSTGSQGWPMSNIKVRGMQLYAAAFTRMAESLNINTIRVYRGLTGAPARWQPNALASVAWSAKHATGGERVVKFADIHPSAIVGITAFRECHPVIAPFSVTAGPGHHPVIFENH